MGHYSLHLRKLELMNSNAIKKIKKRVQLDEEAALQKVIELMAMGLMCSVPSSCIFVEQSFVEKM